MTGCRPTSALWANMPCSLRANGRQSGWAGYACRVDKWRWPRREAAGTDGEGALRGHHQIRRPTYEKQRLAERLLWTIVSNLLLVKAAFGSIRRADAVLFTGSPPLMLHFIAPLNLITREKLIYRITDFHPECLIAERGQAGILRNVLLRVTRFWRRRVDMFEVRLPPDGRLVDRESLRSGISSNATAPVMFSPGFVRSCCLMPCATDLVSSCTPGIGELRTTRTRLSKGIQNIFVNRDTG